MSTTQSERVRAGMQRAKAMAPTTPAPVEEPLDMIKQLRLAIEQNNRNLLLTKSTHTRLLISRAIVRDNALLAKLTRERR